EPRRGRRARRRARGAHRGGVSRRVPSVDCMQKRHSSKKAAIGPVLGRRRFAKISAVEGIALTGAMKRAFVQFDRAGLSAEERRDLIIGMFKASVGQGANV